MSLYFSNELEDVISNELESVVDSVDIISAFCKKEAFESVCNNLNNNITRKRLLIRYRLTDILAGATDADIYELCKEKGWELYIRLDLHAKTLVFDDKRALLGSANLTNSGFMLGTYGNCELSTVINLEPKDILKIKLMFTNSIKVTDELYSKFIEEINLNSTHVGSANWSKNLLDILDGEVTTLFTYELPEYNSINAYKNQVIDFLELPSTSNTDIIRDAFIRSNCYRWLRKQLEINNNCMYFGSLTKALHEAIINDPKPYRKDVKIYLSNLLSLIEELKIDEILIDRPNYSQRIRLLNS